jgi:hypothetical protein
VEGMARSDYRGKGAVGKIGRTGALEKAAKEEEMIGHNYEERKTKVSQQDCLKTRTFMFLNVF